MATLVPGRRLRRLRKPVFFCFGGGGGGGALTAVEVALEVRGDAVARVVVLQVQTQSQQGEVLLHQLGDLHLDFVAQHLRPLKYAHTIFIHNTK